MGLNPNILDMFGDKVKAREQAIKANIPVIPGTDGPVNSLEEVEDFGEYNMVIQLLLKHHLGGGGRGMRIVNDAK